LAAARGRPAEQHVAQRCDPNDHSAQICPIAKEIRFTTGRYCFDLQKDHATAFRCAALEIEQAAKERTCVLLRLLVLGGGWGARLLWSADRFCLVQSKTFLKIDFLRLPMHASGFQCADFHRIHFKKDSPIEITILTTRYRF
jgi:hypothetical protein